MTTVTNRGGKVGNGQRMDQRSRYSTAAESNEGDGTVDSPAASQLTYHIKPDALCSRHGDPRDTSVARPDLEACTCWRGNACQTCGKYHVPNLPHRNERVCLVCKLPRNKRRDFRDHVSGICNDCTAQIKADEEAAWNSKTEAEHAADGDALFARMAARR